MSIYLVIKIPLYALFNKSCMLVYDLQSKDKDCLMRVCDRCKGEGTYMGLGFMLTDCDVCDDGYEKESISLDKIDRSSKSYKKAIKDIMAINPDISQKDAVKIFDEAYVKG